MVAMVDRHSVEKIEHCLAMEDDSSPPDVITAHRSSDGYLTFDLKISHIIEQTLRRAFNRPNFKKSIIRVVDEPLCGDGDGDCTACTCSNGSCPTHRPACIKSARSVDSTGVDSKHTRSLMAMKRAHSDTDMLAHSTSYLSTSEPSTSRAVPERDLLTFNNDNISSNDADLFIKRLCMRNTDQQSTKTGIVSPIPIDWIKRGISVEEKRQFQRSIANASLCPYESDRSRDTIRHVAEHLDLPLRSSSFEESESLESELEDPLEDPFEDPGELHISDDQYSSTSALYLPSIQSSAPHLYIPTDLQSTDTDTSRKASAGSSLPDDKDEHLSVSLSDDSFGSSMSDHLHGCMTNPEFNNRFRDCPTPTL